MPRTPNGRPRRIYVYVVAVDSGFAPNPFFGRCTLACCKPKIRAAADEGDWVVGITSAKHGRKRRLIYAMEVGATPLSFERYWKLFPLKRPRQTARMSIARQGDNCYRPTPEGGFVQLPSRHYDWVGGTESPSSKAHDLSVNRVLIARRFAYFGDQRRALPGRLTMRGRGHRVIHVTGPREHRLVAWLETLPHGRHGWPLDYPRSEVASRCARRKPRCG